MPQLTSPLDHVKISAPCTANWDEMFSFENNRVRFCSQCNLNVYNLSGMRREEAEALITKTEGRLCVRFYRKADGSILTQNCPVGLKAVKRRVAWVAQVALGMALSFVSSLGLYIFHLGKKPFTPPDIRSLFDTRVATTGALVVPRLEFRPETEAPLIGKVEIDPRRRAQITQGKANRLARKIKE